MTISPSKPKRSAGAFLLVWIAGGVVWIENNYQIERHEKILSWSWRDVDAWTHERQAFVDRSRKFKIENSVYIVVFNCELSEEQQWMIVRHYHDKQTVKVTFDE